MKKHTKKLLSIGLSAALVAPLVLSNQGLVNAVTEKPTKGPVTFVAVDDTKGTKLNVLGKTVTLTKLDQQTGSLESVETAWNTLGNANLSDKGEVAFTDVAAGKYALTLKLDSKTNVTRFLSYTPKTSVTKTSVVVPTLDESGKLDRKVSGTISGKLKEEAVTKVAIVGKDTTWTTVTDATGYFSIALPVGTYDVIVLGNDTEGEDDKRNEVYKAIKVVAGQSSTPLDEMSAGVKWGADANKLGFTELKTSTKSDAVSTFTNASKEYKGTLSAAGKVNAYVLDDKGNADKADDVYTLIGEGIAKYDSKTKVAPFSIKLASIQPGKKVVIVAEDEALNRYTKEYAFTDIDPVVKPDSTKNEIGQPIELTFTDASKTYGVSSKLKITAVDKNDGAETPTKITLDEKTSKAANDFSVSNGKIVINSSFFINKFKAKVSDYTFAISGQNGFKDQTVDQSIVASTTAAAALSVKAEAGSASGTTKLTVSKASGNTLKIDVLSTAPTAPKAYSSFTGGTEYTSGSDITGVDKTSKKYVAVYELNAEKQVVKFKLLTLTATQIKQ